MREGRWCNGGGRVGGSGGRTGCNCRFCGGEKGCLGVSEGASGRGGGGMEYRVGLRSKYKCSVGGVNVCEGRAFLKQQQQYQQKHGN